MLSMTFRFISDPSTGEFVIKNQISIFEIVSVLGILVAVISFVIAVRAAKLATKTNQAEFSFKLWEAFMNGDVYNAYQKIEWSAFEWGEGFETGFRGDEEEHQTDKLLFLFDEIALQVNSNILTGYYAERWMYFGRRIFGDSEVKRYMEFLDIFFQNNGSEKPFMRARKLFDPS